MSESKTKSKFNSWDWLPDETISTYLAKLRQLTEHYNFGTNVER